ncbi:hypothetical protein P9112_004807 [Eukaryota sp. TZLM1-RC]
MEPVDDILSRIKLKEQEIEADVQSYESKLARSFIEHDTKNSRKHAENLIKAERVLKRMHQVESDTKNIKELHRLGIEIPLDRDVEVLLHEDDVIGSDIHDFEAEVEEKIMFEEGKMLRRHRP